MDVDDKLVHINKKVTLNKTKHSVWKETKWLYKYYHKTNKWSIEKIKKNIITRINKRFDR